MARAQGRQALRALPRGSHASRDGGARLRLPGIGDSGGARGTLSPRMQLEDLVNAVTYLWTREDIAPHRLGAFGSGGTGGGNAVLLAARERRIRCAVSQVPVADGEDWLRRMRREYEWYEFLARLEEDARTRVISGSGALVHPREEIMVPTPERKAAKVKADVDDRIPTLVPPQQRRGDHRLQAGGGRPSGQKLAGHRGGGQLGDPDRPRRRHLRGGREPKKLIMQHRTTHYAAYRQYADTVIPEIVAWYRTHLTGAAVQEVTPGGMRPCRSGHETGSSRVPKCSPTPSYALWTS